MLNKIKLIGKISLSEEKKQRLESLEVEVLKVYFGLVVTNPNLFKNSVRCVARGEVAKKIIQEIKNDDFLEVNGYLRNDLHEERELHENRQIIVKVVSFSKLDSNLVEDTKNYYNKVLLVGRANDIKNDLNKSFLYLRIFAPENLIYVIKEETEKKRIWRNFNFYCSIKKDLPEDLKDRDVLLIEGFLQTTRSKKKELNKVFSLIQEESEKDYKEDYWISLIICTKIIRLGNSSYNSSFNDDSFLYQPKIEIIDFEKEKKNI